MNCISTEFESKIRERLAFLIAEESTLRNEQPASELGRVSAYNIARLHGRIDELRRILNEASKGETNELSPRIPLLHE